HATKAAKANPKRLSVEDGELVVTLPVWAGFCARPGSKPSRGEVLVSVGGDKMLDVDRDITPQQHKAYRYLVDHAADTQRIVLGPLGRGYRGITSRFARFNVALPAKVDAPGLRDLVELRSATIHHAHRNSIAYIGYELACVWDPEHALGVMTHQNI